MLINLFDQNFQQIRFKRQIIIKLEKNPLISMEKFRFYNFCENAF